MGCHACVCPICRRLPMARTCSKGCKMQVRCVHDTVILAKGAASRGAVALSAAAHSVSVCLPAGSCLLFDWAQPAKTMTNAECCSDTGQQRRISHLPWYVFIRAERKKKMRKTAFMADINQYTVMSLTFVCVSAASLCTLARHTQNSHVWICQKRNMPKERLQHIANIS